MAILADISLRRGIGLLILVLVILAGGIWTTIKVTTDYMLDADATSNARDWAHFIAANVSDLEQIANGDNRPEPVVNSSTRRAKPVKSIATWSSTATAIRNLSRTATGSGSSIFRNSTPRPRAPASLACPSST